MGISVKNSPTAATKNYRARALRTAWVTQLLHRHRQHRRRRNWPLNPRHGWIPRYQILPRWSSLGRWSRICFHKRRNKFRVVFVLEGKWFCGKWGLGFWRQEVWLGFGRSVGVSMPNWWGFRVVLFLLLLLDKMTSLSRWKGKSFYNDMDCGIDEGINMAMWLLGSALWDMKHTDRTVLLRSRLDGFWILFSMLGFWVGYWVSFCWEPHNEAGFDGYLYRKPARLESKNRVNVK